MSPFLTGGHHTQSLYIKLTLHAKFTSPAPPPLAISTENPFFSSPPHHSLPPLFVCPYIMKVDSSGPAVLMMSRLIPSLLLGVKRAVLVFLLLLPATCRGTAAFPVRVSCVGEALVCLTCSRSWSLVTV